MHHANALRSIPSLCPLLLIGAVALLPERSAAGQACAALTFLITEFETGDGPLAVIAEDLDNDGDVDGDGDLDLSDAGTGPGGGGPDEASQPTFDPGDPEHVQRLIERLISDSTRIAP